MPKACASQLLAGAIVAASALHPGSTSASQRPIAELTPVVTLPTGKSSTWVEVTPESVWVASLDPNVVHRIDPRTDKMTAHVTLPRIPCSGLAAGLGSLWVPLCGPTPSLAKIDLSTQRITAVFKVGPPAEEGGVTTSPDSVWLVVDKMGSLARINPTDGSIRQIVHIPADSYNPVFSEGRIWITHAKGAEVTAVDASSGQVVGTVDTGAKPRFLTAGSGSVWTLNAGDGTVSRIDARALKVTQTISLNVPARGGDIKYEEGKVWVTLQKTPLTAIDANTGRLLCQWTGAGGDSLGLGHQAIWVSNVREANITRFDTNQSLAHCE
jgi:virginiamycin B lyase